MPLVSNFRRPSLQQRSDFELLKWYLDCVSADGSVFIGYAGTLRWKALSLNFSSILECQRDEEPVTRSSLLRVRLPESSAGAVQWTSPSLGVTASWRALSASIEHTVYESEKGKINWSCLAPIANARIQTQRQPQLTGLGYAEQISMTVPAWNLPMDELRWGRFLSSEGAHLTWIDWRGPVPISLVFFNGSSIEGAKVSDEEIDFCEGKLKIAISSRRILRDGPLVTNALSAIPGVKNIFPGNFLESHETKWCAEGWLSGLGANDIAGWVIYEVVRWKR
jgi:hypothetical protein